MRGGWVGSDVWDKVPNKYVFFLTPSLMPLAICLLLLRWVVLEPLVCLATMAFGAYITQQGIYRQLEQSL